jgi:hypothetical protein
MDRPGSPDRRARRVGIAVGALVAVAAFGAGTAFGVAVGSDDDKPVSSASSATPLGLEPTLRSYLGALVSHDWPAAHALMCADLGERITAGALKEELARSEQRAGALSGFTITSQPPNAKRSATVAYSLHFVRGSIDIRADLNEEGPTWRVCSFTNGRGSGAFG